jgi:CelD/BcsL family acetyltransferase involved in cellulose biosynthesis
MTTTTVNARILNGFDAIDPQQWSALLRRGDTDAVNLTWPWQRGWWEAFGRGRLLLVGAEDEGELAALAPLFADGGMIFNVCPEDHLDFVGDVGDPEILDALLETARAQVQDFVGFTFYFVPDTSRTGPRLRAAADRLGLVCCLENETPCPRLDLAGQPEAARASTRKKSLVRHERFFRREGELQVRHMGDATTVLGHLDEFFDQHVARRAATAAPSLFTDPAQREYYRRQTRVVGPLGWLRFTRIDWNGRPIAFHYGLCYRGRYLFGIPTFAIDLARRSPGEVLLRQLLLAAIEEGARCFDFGIGGEAYKDRFATDVPRLQTWGLYPR